jgi:hypothetical protein
VNSVRLKGYDASRFQPSAHGFNETAACVISRVFAFCCCVRWRAALSSCSGIFVGLSGELDLHPRLCLLEFQGLGKGIRQGVDVDEYPRRERSSWSGVPHYFRRSNMRPHRLVASTRGGPGGDQLRTRRRIRVPRNRFTFAVRNAIQPRFSLSPGGRPGPGADIETETTSHSRRVAWCSPDRRFSLPGQ